MMGVLMVIAAWGEGVNECLCPPPPSQIVRLSPKTRVKNTGVWTVKENMLYSVGARMLNVSMVIAAWGEGVNVCLCPPSPSSDRFSLAQKACKKCWLGSSDTPPLTARVSAPPRALSEKRDKNILADL
jgi:hypothetical protein